MVEFFLSSLIPHIYRILTSYESCDGGDNYKAYLDSLSFEMVGAFKTFPQLKEVADYIQAVNILNFLVDHNVGHYQCRRATFEMKALIEGLLVNFEVIEDD